MTNIDDGIIINGILYEHQVRFSEGCHCEECDLNGEICDDKTHRLIDYCIHLDAYCFKKSGTILSIFTKEEKEQREKEQEMSMALMTKLAKAEEKEQTYREPILFFPQRKDRIKYINLCHKVAKFFCEKVGVGESYRLYAYDNTVNLFVEDPNTGEEFHVATWGNSSGNDMMNHYFRHPEFYKEMK